LVVVDRECNCTPLPTGTTAHVGPLCLAPAGIFLDHSANWSHKIRSARLAQCFNYRMTLAFLTHDNSYRSWLRLPGATLS